MKHVIIFETSTYFVVKSCVCDPECVSVFHGFHLDMVFFCKQGAVRLKGRIALCLSLIHFRGVEKEECSN